MLRFLAIRNLAVIREVEIPFDSRLSVLTGETGAGKSILVEAVGLLLGGRASPDLVRTGADAATVQAAATLRELGARLVDLHGQHEHQALLDPQTHLDLLDRFAGLDPARRTVEQAFADLQTAAASRDEMRGMAAERASRLELIEFQLAEIERVRPRAGEDGELSQLRSLLSSAERVRRLSEESYSILYDRDDAVLAALGQVWRRVEELAALDARFATHLEVREPVKSQLEDLAALLRGYASGIDASPERLQAVEDRLALLERLKRKHGPELADVLAKERSLREQAASLESLDDGSCHRSGAVPRRDSRRR
jgi:DNA repair protein RecN (Recombination protein N)